jgi:hypothetical protein
MRFARAVFAAIFSALLSSVAIAGSREGNLNILSRKEGAGTALCGENCIPPRVYFEVQDYCVVLQGDCAYGTRMRTWYRVNDPADVGKFLFVQFIRGCVFASRKEGDEILRSHQVIVPYRGETRTFCSNEWYLDSSDDDPAYGTVPGKDRYFNYRVTENGASPWTSERYYQRGVDQVMSLFVTDRPSPAFRVDDRAQNVDLEFLTCLYRANDLPTNVPEPAEPLMEKALYCFSWKSRFIFDHNRRRFER